MMSREDRLWTDFEGMQTLKAESTILEFSTENDPPDRLYGYVSRQRDQSKHIAENDYRND